MTALNALRGISENRSRWDWARATIDEYSWWCNASMYYRYIESSYCTTVSIFYNHDNHLWVRVSRRYSNMSLLYSKLYSISSIEWSTHCARNQIQKSNQTKMTSDITYLISTIWCMTWYLRLCMILHSDLHIFLLWSESKYVESIDLSST